MKWETFDGLTEDKQQEWLFRFEKERVYNVVGLMAMSLLLIITSGFGLLAKKEDASYFGGILVIVIITTIFCVVMVLYECARETEWIKQNTKVIK